MQTSLYIGQNPRLLGKTQSSGRPGLGRPLFFGKRSILVLYPWVSYTEVFFSHTLHPDGNEINTGTSSCLLYQRTPRE
jgi:hypothetical protein